MSMIIDGTNGLTFNNNTVQASAGQVLQVVSATTSTTTTANTTTFVDSTLTATITPKFVSSKILILVSQNGFIISPTTGSTAIKLLRNSTDIITFSANAGYTGAAGSLYGGSISCNFLDSPATVSATTYKTQFNSRSNAPTVQFQESGATSTITLMEIAA